MYFISKAACCYFKHYFKVFPQLILGERWVAPASVPNKERSKNLHKTYLQYIFDIVQKKDKLSKT